jgi:hypothetical protein
VLLDCDLKTWQKIEVRLFGVWTGQLTAENEVINLHFFIVHIMVVDM